METVIDLDRPPAHPPKPRRPHHVKVAAAIGVLALLAGALLVTQRLIAPAQQTVRLERVGGQLVSAVILSANGMEHEEIGTGQDYQRVDLKAVVLVVRGNFGARVGCRILVDGVAVAAKDTTGANTVTCLWAR